MQKWLQDNLWTLVIAGSALVSSYALYGYRLTAVELEANANQTAIAAVNVQQVQIQIALAQLQTDVSYIKQVVQSGALK